MKPVYLDHGTLAPPSSHLTSQMQPFMKRHFHGVTSPYLHGKEPFVSVERALGDIRAFVGAHPKDAFYFTSSGSAAISSCFQTAYFDHIAQSGKNHVITVSSEEAPIRLLCKQYEKVGVFHDVAPLNENGQFTLEQLKSLITPKTGLVSLSWANSLTGVIHPVWELAEFCKENGILFHVDASQVLGKIYFRFEELPIDFLTFDGPIVHGPKGSGALFVRRGVESSPLVFEGMDGAALNTPALIGLGIAATEMSGAFDHLCLETARLRDKLEEGIKLAIPEVSILYKDAERLPNVAAISFPGVHHELLAFHLKEGGVFASFGGGQMQKLEYLTNDPCALSFSLSKDTTEEEIDRALGIIINAAQKCRTFSKEVAP